MPGLYLSRSSSPGRRAPCSTSASGSCWRSPAGSLLAVAAGTVFFLAWDAVGIAAGVFVKGDSLLLLGVDLAPQLPLEEPFFLAFLAATSRSWSWARRGASELAGTPAIGCRVPAAREDQS